MTTKRTPSRSKWVRRSAIVVLAMATLATALFGLRTYRSFILLRSAYEAGAPMTSSIRPWMTLDYITATYRTRNAALVERLGLPPGTEPHASLKSLAEKAGLSPPQYTQVVQRAIADIAPTVRSDRVNETSGWLGTIGDEVLTALLVYGYPVLGLTLFLCAIGLPLPDGVATTVAGSLIAQGRMDWVWAGTITMAAAIVGDAAGYGLGRLLGREVLERHGRWLGYTATRRERVQLLFERWGSLTVFITRTFMSYLAAVASVLAGMSHYRLSKFLAIDACGSRDMDRGLPGPRLWHRI